MLAEKRKLVYVNLQENNPQKSTDDTLDSTG